MLSRVLGDVQIEERRPRTWNEPRRKRLSFVRQTKPKSRRPGDWAVVPHGGRGQNNADMWDRRQYEAQQRFMHQDHMHQDRMHQNHMHQDHMRRQLEWQHQARLQQHPYQHGHPHGHHPGHQNPQPQHHHPGMHGAGRIEDHHAPPPRIEEIAPRPHYGSDGDTIVAIEDGDSDDSSDDDDDDLPRIIPLRIDRERDRPEMPRIIQLNYPKSEKKKKKHHHYHHHHYDSSSDSSSSGDDSFIQGFVAGRKASLQRGSRSLSSRRRRYEGHYDSESEDSMDLRRRRSKSRGRRH